MWTSNETKAIEAARILAARCDLPVLIEPDLHENDRSATGFLPPDEFEQIADEFFRIPRASVQGWERAIDAQDRIAAAIDRILASSPPGDVALVAHGAVGALLLCRYLGAPISREHDQPFQGHAWSFDRESRKVLHRWRPIAPRTEP